MLGDGAATYYVLHKGAFIPISRGKVRLFKPKGFWKPFGFKGLPPLYIKTSREPIGITSHPCEGRDPSDFQKMLTSLETWMGSRLRGNDFPKKLISTH